MGGILCAPTPSDLFESTTPTPSDSSESTTPTPTDLFESTTPTSSDLFESATPTSSDLLESTTPTSSDLFESATPTPSDLFESTTPTSSDLFESATPTPSDLFESTTPTSSDLFESTTPTPSDLFESTTTTPSVSTESTTPTPSDSSESIPGHLNSLPPEIFEKIFNNIPDKKQIQGFRLVNRYWDFIIRGIYEITLIIGRHDSHAWKICSLCQAQNLSVIIKGCSSQLLKNMSDKNFVLRLKSLTFTHFTFNYNVIPLLQQCVNLQSLELSDIPSLFLRSIDCEIDWDDSTKTLPALKNLKIDNSCFCEKQNVFIKSLLPFFMGQNGKGKLVSIEFQNDQLLWMKHPKYIFQNFWTFSQHQVSIQTIAIHLIRENLPTLHEVIIQGKPKPSEVEMSKTLLGFTNSELTRFEQEMDYWNNPWWEILETLKTLRSIRVYGYRESMVPSILEALQGNALTLELLSVVHNIFEDDDPEEFSVDLDFDFHDNRPDEVKIKEGKTKSLKRYTLECKYDDVIYKNFGIMTGTVSIAHLPRNIRSLCLGCTLQMGNGIENFCQKNFEHLKTVYHFKFWATPWFKFGLSENWFLRKDKLRDIILWLPNLKKLDLVRFPVVEDGIILPSIPDDTIIWMQEIPGLQIQNEIPPFDTTGSTVHVIDILIESEFRSFYFDFENLYNNPVREQWYYYPW